MRILALALGLCVFVPHALAAVDPGLHAVLKQAGPGFKHCRAQQKQRSGEKPRAVVEIHLAKDGALVRTDVKPAKWKGTAFEACLVDAVKPLHFPAPQRGKAVVLKKRFGLKKGAK